MFNIESVSKVFAVFGLVVEKVRENEWFVRLPFKRQRICLSIQNTPENYGYQNKAEVAAWWDDKRARKRRWIRMVYGDDVVGHCTEEDVILIARGLIEKGGDYRFERGEKC